MTISTINDTDYDENPITIKQCTGNIQDDTTQEYTLLEGVETLSCDSTVTDTDVKTAYKNSLTAKDYTWDSEA